MNGGKQNERGQELDEGQWAWQAKYGHGRQTKPAEQALQADTASGLSARHRPQNKRTAHSWPAAQQKQQLQMTWLAAVQVSGGSTVVLAAMKAGSDLPTVPTPPRSPLPVTVPTHSLNLKNPI